MAAMQPLPIPCPVCGHTIEVPVTGIFEGIVDGAVQYTVEIDREPIRQHAAEHVPQDAETVAQDAETVAHTACEDCGGSRECARCEGHGHLDGERCIVCDSHGICPTCRTQQDE